MSLFGAVGDIFWFMSSGSGCSGQVEEVFRWKFGCLRPTNSLLAHCQRVCGDVTILTGFFEKNVLQDECGSFLP